MKPKVKQFDFKKYSFDKDSRTASFEYGIKFLNKKEPLNFIEKIEFPRANNVLPEKDLDAFLKPLFIIIGISYYKLYLPKKVTLPFELDKDQAEFWNSVYRNGLGELIYQNKLDPKNIAKFPYSKKKIKHHLVSMDSSNHVLLGIGGGKDSIVAAELLKENKIPTTSFLIETQKTYDHLDMTIKAIGNPVVKVSRYLDPKIFEKYEGSFDGHIPISAIYAFVALVVSAMYGYKYVAVANEYGSNFGNIKYKGQEINHQWSKTSQFESSLQEYTSKFITKDITYFSALRQFNEIRIVEMFSRYKKYFHIFTSCNRNFSINKHKNKTLWCGECPKCHFVFLMLSAFLSKEELLDIFGQNLFADEKNLQMFKDLIGIGDMKPFDCVGTFEESRAAFYLAKDRFADDVVIQKIIPQIKDGEKCVKEVFKAMPAKTLPTQFKFLGIKNVCILGYGREGKVTEKYLKKYYPHLKVDILDQETDKEYLEKQKDYDLAIKTPGIRPDKITIPYTTASNIFFSRINNLTIGITGTKGKSTTTSLIYEILREAGKKVHLIGNIGIPMLSVLVEKKITSEDIFVIELSSYQLEDMEYSPNISVFLNIYEGHSEAHGGFEEYKKAKENIFKFQKEGDVLFKGPFPTTPIIKIKQSDIPLIGKHNVHNINVAIKIAKHLKISEKVIKRAIKNFKPLDHRLEKVGVYNDIIFYNDSIASTPDATIAALSALKNVDTLFLGGSTQKFNFKKMEDIIHKSKIRNVVLFPENGNNMIKNKKKLNIFHAQNMYDAVDFAFKNTKKDRICLLSPASASFSLWRDFEDRGNEFKRIVRGYKG